MLKTSNSLDYFKQEVNRSELIREEKKDTPPSSSQQILIDSNVPEGFTIGKAIGGGDCFFDAVAQGLNQIKPGGNFTRKSLRKICKIFAQSQLGLDSSWLIEALKNDRRTIFDYIERIEFTADDIKKGSKVIDRLKLTTAMWGLPEIEGRIICTVYKVRLHLIEVHTTSDGENVITHHIMDREGYQKGVDHEISNKKVYSGEDTIHIINKGDFHFEPILRETAQQMLPRYYDTMDSESVYFQQNSEVEMKDATDNQMDCEYYKGSSSGVEVLPAESTIGATVDYEELQYKQSQESLVSSRVADSSSIDSGGVWYSALTDCRSTVGTANDTDLTDYEIVKRAALFVKIFFEKFERKLSELSEEAKPSSKTRKSGKIVDQSASIVNNFIPPSGVKLIFSKLCESMCFFSAKEHRKGAKKVSAAVTPFKNEIREILVKAGLEIFQNFESQFTKIQDTDQLYWERGIEKLAIDAVSRVINYITVHSKEEVFSVDLITKGVVLGQSKRSLMHVGHRVRDEQDGKILMTSKLYGGVGIVKIDSGITEYYRSREYDCSEKYGYRLPFAWELEKWWEVNRKYMLVNQPKKEEYVRVLDGEKKKRLASSILKEINEDDPTKRIHIEELYEKIENLQIKKEESIRPFLFNIGQLPRLFIKRRRMLVDLANMLEKESQEFEMSRTVLISGRHGTGKSELAKSYVYDKENGTWKNIIWINAEMPSILLSSFHRLAQELEISIEKGKDIKKIDVKVKTERQQERKVKSIVEDIYKNFRDAKSLFIFDKVSSYKDIEEFLPSYFFHLFVGREKPYVLITSSSKNWTGEMEKIVLDEGFTLPEAIDFIETALSIDGRLCNADLITELAKTLLYSPLALKRATKHIKEEGISISQYLKLYSQEMQKLNFDYLKEHDISPELFITLKINCDKIKEEENVGKRSHDLLSFMAYLSPDQIDTVEFFFQEESEKDQQSTLDALNLLDKFSLIELEESIARVHMGVQKTIRLEKEQAGTEEEVLRRVMTSFMYSGTTSVSHIVSAWSHVSKYSGLINEFINSTYNGNTILHLLAKDGNEQVIKRILKKVDSNKLSKIINTVDKMKFTPLDCAAMHGHLEIVKYFIEKGIDLYRDNRDLTPLHWAAFGGQLEVVKHFIDNRYWEIDKLSGESGTPLQYAIVSGNIDVVKYLIEKGANVNLQDESAGPLHLSIEENRLDIVEYLVENRADVNLRDKNSHGSLHYAVINNNINIVKYLIGREKVNLNLQDKDGMGPLHYAVINNNIDIIKYLIEKDADINLQDKDGMGPLHYAAKNGYLGIVKYLVEEGGSIDLQDEDGMSPVHWAVKNGHLDIVKYLVEEGGSVNLEDVNGMSPSYYAVANGHLDIAECLLKLGAKINQKSKDFLYRHASSNNYPDIICYPEAQSSALDLRIQSHKRHQKRSAYFSKSNKKRKLEDVSATSKENTSNIQLLQGSQDNVNLPSDMSMQFEGLLGKMESMFSAINRAPMSSFNRVAVESMNNKNLQVG